MADITKSLQAKTDQLNAEDTRLMNGIIITITRDDYDVGRDQPLWLYYKGDGGRPFKPCKGMRRVIRQFWGPESDNYIGKRMKLFCDDSITYGKDKWGGVRISQMQGIAKPTSVVVKAKRGVLKEYVIHPIEEPNKDLGLENNRVERGVNDLIARIKLSDDLCKLANEPAVIQQRAWLYDNRPELAKSIDLALAEAEKATAPNPNTAPFGQDHDDDYNDVRNALEQDEQPMWKQHFDKTMASVLAATNKAELQAAEIDFLNNRVTYDDDAIEEMDRQISSAKKRIGTV